MPRIYSDLAEYYDAVYSFKDYRAEALRVMALARRSGRSGGREWLDVGCGTGHHLRYFARRYRCTGVDASPAMVQLARRRVPGARLVRGDMRRLRLRREYDVVSCLFSAIGYMRSLAELRQAIDHLAVHLKPGGVLVIEPWLTPAVYRPGGVHLRVDETPNLKIARANTSELRGRLSILRMHYLIAERGRPIRYAAEVHSMGLFTVPETLRLLRRSGLRARFLRRGLMPDRGLFVAVRPVAPPNRRSPGRARR